MPYGDRSPAGRSGRGCRIIQGLVESSWVGPWDADCELKDDLQDKVINYSVAGTTPAQGANMYFCITVSCIYLCT